MGEDGLHKPSWFTTTFKDLAEDIETAREEGKRLAIRALEIKATVSPGHVVVSGILPPLRRSHHTA